MNLVSVSRRDGMRYTRDSACCLAGTKSSVQEGRVGYDSREARYLYIATKFCVEEGVKAKNITLLYPANEMYTRSEEE